MVFLSRIYTKSGDEGETGLGNGNRVPKDHPRVAAYGEVDELNSTLGVLLTLEDIPDRPFLESIQHDLFDLGADLCVPITPDEIPGACLRIEASQVERLEKAIDRWNEPLEPLRSFVLPGGNPLAAYLHLARTVCRRSERAITTLMKAEPINPEAYKYINRLSDLLFVLARACNGNGTRDILWIPGKSRN